MRRLVAFLLVLGLAPGVSGGLLQTVLGGAHCAHPCCQGQDFCHKGSGHDHEADHTMADDHGGHATPVTFAVTAIEPPSESCLETCGVLPNARPKTEGAKQANQTETIQLVHPVPRPLVLVVESRILEDPASPRGPPR